MRDRSPTQTQTKTERSRKMAKKIGLGIIAAMIVIGVTVFAADSRHFIGLQQDIRTVLKGILSPEQISTLMDFRRDHGERFHWKERERPDLFKTWKELNLNEGQQKQLLKIAGDLVDKTHPYLMTMTETDSELKRRFSTATRIIPRSTSYPRGLERKSARYSGTWRSCAVKQGRSLPRSRSRSWNNIAANTTFASKAPSMPFLTWPKTSQPYGVNSS